ncbi:MAG: L-lactate dehydrogenase [Chloroflexi bacterium RBG_16_57_11]|nr:MAG: L-lactate dehydrogenase [Chloroflexi bacterium RBG_16_57_11]
MERWRARKVVTVGAGAVGSTFAYALAQSGVADEIVLMDMDQNLAQGQVMDLAHGLPFYPNVQIAVGSADDYADAHVIVITAGSKQRPGESRLALLQRNARIIESLMDEISAQGSQAVIVVVSNPVDILTYVAQQRVKWPRGRVIGSGTVLDSARFRYLLSQHGGVNVHNVHAYILGEHGDSEFAAWSMTHVAGMKFDEYCQMCGDCMDWQNERREIEEAVRTSAYHIIDYKGSTYFAVGQALVRIVSAIVRNERSVLTVSTMLEGEYGLSEVCLGVPAMVGEAGVDRVLEMELPTEERLALERSADILKEAIAQLSQAEG